MRTVISDLMSSKNIMYYVTTYIFIFFVSFIVCFWFFNTVNPAAGSGTICIASCLCSVIATGVCFMIEIPLIRFSFVRNWIKLKPEEFKYSIIEHTDKFKDGHTSIYYTAYIQLERFGQQYHIGWSYNFPSGTGTIPDDYSLKNIENNIEAFIKYANIDIAVIGLCKTYKTKKMAEWAVNCIKKQISIMPWYYNVDCHKLVSSTHKKV